MSNDESTLAQNLLKDYGDPIASYDGHGVLKLQDAQEVNCTFEAGQLRTGDVLLLCKFSFPAAPPSWLFDWLFSGLWASRFEGRTQGGHKVFADERIMRTNYLPRGPVGRAQETFFTATEAFRLHEMHVQMTEGDVRARSARFGVINFIFTGTEWHQSGNWSHLSLPLSLKSATKEAQLSIQPVKGYNTIE